MATLQNLVGNTVGGMADLGSSVPEPVAVISGAVAVAYVGAQVFPLAAEQFGGMSTEKALTLFSILGGASGALSQFMAAENFEALDRGINIIELFPALVAIVISSAAAAFLLTTPTFLNRVRGFIRAAQRAAGA